MKQGALCILFMCLMAYAVQEAESTLLLKTLLIKKLLDKFFHKDPLPVVKPLPKPIPAPVYKKPIVYKKTAGTKPYIPPGRYPVVAKPVEYKRTAPPAYYKEAYHYETGRRLQTVA